MAKKILIVVDYECLVQDSAIFSVLSKSERRTFNNEILPAENYDILCKGQQYNFFCSLNSRKVASLSDYLESFIEYVSTRPEADLYHNSTFKTPITASSSALLNIARKILKAVSMADETLSLMSHKWKSFFKCIRQEYLAPSDQHSHQLFCAITLECPPDLEFHCRRSMEAAGIIGWPILSSNRFHFSRYEQDFWQLAQHSISKFFDRQVPEKKARLQTSLCCSYASTFKCCMVRNCELCYLHVHLTFDHILYIDDHGYYKDRISLFESIPQSKKLLYLQLRASKFRSATLTESINICRMLFCHCCKCTSSKEQQKYGQRNTNFYSDDFIGNKCVDELAFFLEETVALYTEAFLEPPVLNRSLVFVQDWRNYLKQMTEICPIKKRFKIEDTKDCMIDDALQTITAFVCTRIHLRLMESSMAEVPLLGNVSYKVNVQRMIRASETKHELSYNEAFHYMIFLNGYKDSHYHTKLKGTGNDDAQIWNRIVSSSPDENNSHHITKTVCADGAYSIKGLLTPDHVIGDFDSINACRDRRSTAKEKPQFHYLPDQNSTDFQKALKFIQKETHYRIQVERNGLLSKLSEYHSRQREGKLDYLPKYLSLPQTSVLVLGAGGGRKDHEMCIYKSLIDNAPRHHVIVCKMENNYVIPIAPGRNYSISGVSKHTKCGVVPIGAPTINVSTEGLQWELNGVYLDLSASSESGDLYSRSTCEENGTGFIQVDYEYANSGHVSPADTSNIQESGTIDFPAPTISTSNSLCGPRSCTANFKQLLVKSIEALEEEMIKTRKNQSRSKEYRSCDRHLPDIGSDKINSVCLKIASLHTPLLLLIEDVSE